MDYKTSKKIYIDFKKDFYEYINTLPYFKDEIKKKSISIKESELNELQNIIDEFLKIFDE